MLRRILQTMKLYSIRDARERAQYAKRKNIYGYIGNNVMIQPRKVPLYAKLIKMHDNVWIASNVTFVTHDVIHQMLGWMYPNETFQEKVGCIELMDNVFIGNGSIVMYNIRIGPNVIVAAGSVVTKDVPPNSVVAGVPARIIGCFSDYVEKRSRLVQAVKRDEATAARHDMDDDSAMEIWRAFDESRAGMQYE